MRVPATALALAASTSAHSWIEYAYKVAPNGTLAGAKGYARGYMPRTDPGFKDTVPQLLLPVTGQSAYSGNEIINKYPFQAKPAYPMLEASPGDHIAIIHFENGHVTLPQNQPNKPLNRGTVYLYGTAQPADKEKLFDVHLRWNQDSTGGNKRGSLLATRNYDDGQCFQPNTSPITNQRIAKLGAMGAKNTQELGCQSDVKLPADLKPGSVYTIYWYWDWPSLNPGKINIEKTADGNYPWAGSFMRGDPVPNDWTMAAIAHNESYASVMDIKIIDGAGQDAVKGFAAKADNNAAAWIANQNIYSQGIKDQMQNNFQVKVPMGAAAASDTTPATASSQTAATSAGDVLSAVQPPAQGGATTGAQMSSAVQAPEQGGVTVTKTVTVAPTTLVTTVYRPAMSSGAPPCPSPDEDVSVTVTLTTHVPRPTGAPTGTSSAPTQPGTDGAVSGRPSVQPFRAMRR